MQARHVSGRLTISVTHPHQLVVLGKSIDFRLCKGNAQANPPVPLLQLPLPAHVRIGSRAMRGYMHNQGAGRAGLSLAKGKPCCQPDSCASASQV